MEIFRVSFEVRTDSYVMSNKVDRLCGLVVKFLATDPEVRV
jgi:hypothetical protein